MYIVEVWARREGERDGPMGWEGAGRKAAEEPVRVKATSAAGRGGMRRSEKAKVPEEALPEVQRLRDPRMSEHILTRKHQAHQHHTHPHAASGWRIHCGVEVTELSTNKQHSLSKSRKNSHVVIWETLVTTRTDRVGHRGKFIAVRDFV